MADASHTPPRTRLRYTTARGLVLHLRVPPTAREWLDVELALAGCATPDADDGWRLAESLGSLITGHNADGALADVLEYALSPQDLTGALLAVREAAGLTEAIRAEVEHVGQVGAAGGCKCRICSGKTTWEDAAETTRAMCEYKDTHPTTHRLLALAGPLLRPDGCDASAPWWVYQLSQALAVGRHRHWRLRDERQDVRSAIDELMRKQGR